MGRISRRGVAHFFFQLSRHSVRQPGISPDRHGVGADGAAREADRSRGLASDGSGAELSPEILSVRSAVPRVGIGRSVAAGVFRRQLPIQYRLSIVATIGLLRDDRRFGSSAEDVSVLWCPAIHGAGHEAAYD